LGLALFTAQPQASACWRNGESQASSIAIHRANNDHTHTERLAP